MFADVLKTRIRIYADLCARLTTGGVRKGLEGLVRVDQVLVTRLWSVLAPGLT